MFSGYSKDRRWWRRFMKKKTVRRVRRAVRRAIRSKVKVEARVNDDGCVVEAGLPNGATVWGALPEGG
eukprot:4624616-Pyramimonas_sp.AAC.2